MTVIESRERSAQKPPAQKAERHTDSAPRSTPDRTPESSEASRRDIAQKDAAQNDAKNNAKQTDSAKDHAPNNARLNDASSDDDSTLFASATIQRDRSERSRRSTDRPSQAYVPMLPEDFYSSNNVRHDPIASEVGVADMQPADNDSGGFRYLERRPLEVTKTKRGVVQPYPLTNVFSTFGDCRPGGRTHSGLDVGGVGKDGGIGTPIYAMSRAKVTFIGRPEDDPDKFGQPDRGKGTTQRGPRSAKLPRSKEIPGYGVVNFFTRTYGSWRTGTILVMEGVDGPLKGHRIRYMHLGAVHPGLEVGDTVEGGQEVGLMGGTAILHDMPHVHIDIENAKGQRVDVAPYIGLPADKSSCR